MELNIKNKVVLVTASSKGIGKAAAERFAAEGCKVALCARNRESLIEAANDITKKYDNEPVWFLCDLNNPIEIENTIKAIENTLGTIEILVNNCGGPAAGLFKELSEEQWYAGIEQVLMSAIRFTQKVIPQMILKEWGRVINITSISVKQPIDNLLLSNTLRTGLVGFAKSLSNEVARFNITVNNVAPGYTLTNRLYELAVVRAKKTGISHEEVLIEMAKEIPMKRLAHPDEIASLVVFLASERASYLTGNTIQVDGGWVKGVM